jgi:hypothetical protein
MKFLGVVLLLVAGLVIFAKGGTRYQLQHGWERRAEAAATAYDRIVAQSPQHQICSRIGCSRPSTHWEETGTLLLGRG